MSSPPSVARIGLGGSAFLDLFPEEGSREKLALGKGGFYEQVASSGPGGD